MIISHPFMTDSLEHEVDREDALNRCVATLHLLSDLFATAGNGDGILNTHSARMGMFCQLQSMADVLAAISRQDLPISFTVGDEELVLLDQIAERWGCTREDAAHRVIREELKRRINPSETTKASP